MSFDLEMSSVNKAENLSKDFAAQKMLAELSVPSKTFLMGEYLAVFGEPSLLVTTQPRFCLRVFEGESNSVFHPESPAGRLLQKKPTDLSLGFVDPYDGAGGMGASSAQFILVETFLNDCEESWQRTYREFRDLHSNLKYPPSGADVVAQVKGGLSYFDPAENSVRVMKWQFRSLDFSLIKTSSKLATHDHLKSSNQLIEKFEKSPERAAAALAVKNSVMALAENNARNFFSGFQSFSQILKKMSLAADQTLEFISKLEQELGKDIVLAAKGCGAMGADVICILHPPQDKIQIQNYCERNEFLYLASSNDIEKTGLSVLKK